MTDQTRARRASLPGSACLAALVLTALTLCAFLCARPARAAEWMTPYLEQVQEWGVMRGDSQGNLHEDRNITRAEFVTMVNRAFGYTDVGPHTFADVNPNDWFAEDISIAHQAGYFNGTSPTTFGAADPCTAKAYTIFLLRALGYQDETDFSAYTAQSFAAKLGMMDTSALTGSFLRDDLAALTYQALGLDMKDGSTYLLDHLIKEGYIDANDAYPMVEKIENCRALTAASETMSKGMSANIKTSMSVTVAPQGAAASEEPVRVQHKVLSGSGNIKMVPSVMPQVAYDITMKEEGGESNRVQMWMQNGWLYVQSGETAYKMELPEMADLSNSMTKAAGVSVLPFVDYLPDETSGEDKIYTMEFNDAFADILNDAIAAALKASGLPENVMSEIKFDAFKLKYTVKDGSLKTANADLSMSVDMDANMGEAPTVMMSVGMTMELEMEIASTGAGVKISYPDFSKFQEIIGGADGPTGIFAGDAA